VSSSAAAGGRASVFENERVGAVAGLEAIEEPILLAKVSHEVEIGLVVLNQVVARRVIACRPDRDPIGGVAAILEDALHDRRDGEVLKHPRASAQRERVESRRQRDPIDASGPAASRGDPGHARREPVDPALAEGVREA